MFEIWEHMLVRALEGPILKRVKLREKKHKCDFWT